MYQERTRGKAIALSTAILGLAVLVAAGLAFKERLLERHWLWKLRAGEEGERIHAAVQLGNIRSERALPALGVVVLGAAALGFRATLFEHWYILRLERGDEPARNAAAKRLGTDRFLIS